MSIFSTTKLSGANAWVGPVSLMCLLSGLLLSAAWVTGAKGRSLNRDPDLDIRLQNGSIDAQQKITSLQSEVAKLREEKTKMENALAGQTGQATLLNETLQESKAFAGLLEVKGPGIKITLSDSQNKSIGGLNLDNLIHDVDVLRAVNECWASGAEAISVNNHRVGPGSSFRCVGTTVMVDGARTSSPVIIRAIGDPDVLSGALLMRDGALDQISKTDPSMVKVEPVSLMTLPAYSGNTEHKFAKVVTSHK